MKIFQVLATLPLASLTRRIWYEKIDAGCPLNCVSQEERMRFQRAARSSFQEPRIG
jgi:hypothetical protein